MLQVQKHTPVVLRSSWCGVKLWVYISFQHKNTLWKGKRLTGKFSQHRNNS
ncbi:hypothetical protein EXN66_Car018128 [Channa argus]|uniref:Uncharacterized protein n=1 Tax=Channa argus TaxID=215402 RepID=A0A6G1QIC0_CHAAH|nr:hypothetical protein EXN66_Car018128 [Channa argus]